MSYHPAESQQPNAGFVDRSEYIQKIEQQHFDVKLLDGTKPARNSIVMTFLIPDSPALDLAQSKPATAGEYISRRSTYPSILLVDDDSSVRESVCRVLSGQQLNVIAAADGAEAIRLAEQRKPDLIITDLCMAGVDGWELLFHQNRIRPDLPIFVTTALPAEETCGADQFASAFFQKPLDFDALLIAIRRHLKN